MKVYLSSTLNDLGPERQAVKEALGGECIVVESYTADERSVRKSCLADVEGCDLYIGIVGLRYGFVPPGEPKSITELEYEAAKQCAFGRLVFVKDPDAIAFSKSDAATGEHPLERIAKFRERIGGGGDDHGRGAVFRTPEDLKAHVLKAYYRLVARREAGDRESGRQARITGDPYPGLRAFRPNEHDRFFGREAEVEALVERVVGRGERFVALIGDSGAGKSSLVYAGLIPFLCGGTTVAGMRWIPVAFTPRELGDDPFLALAAALARALPDAGWRAGDLSQRLRDHPEVIGPVIAEGLRDEAASVLLFADQFEEVFAAKVGTGTCEAFFRLLSAAAGCPRLRVVVAMRSDFYVRWPQDEAALALLRAGHFPVGVPGPAALEQMIVGPARAGGLTIKPSLVQRILREAGSALALAEFALAQLYEKRSATGELTEAAYESIGGVAGAIDDLAEKAVKKAERAVQRAGGALAEEDLARLFLALASVEEKDDQRSVVRRRATRAELTPAALVLVEQLVDDRMLVSSGGTDGAPVRYEAGHEALFSHWRRFTDWYARYENDLALVRQAERAANEWARAGSPGPLLWGWERQKPALEALLALHRPSAYAGDAAYADTGLHAWRAVEPLLAQPLRDFLSPEPVRLLGELSSDATPHDRREAIGLRLNQFGDPRRGVGLDAAGLPDIAWVDVPAGRVVLETNDRDEFAVAPFRIARYPITWQQYRAFLDAADGYRSDCWWDELQREEAPGDSRWAFPNYPAINVSWYDAVAFCRWLSAELQLPEGETVRLPTEWEWKWAAQDGVAVREYPWPGNWNAARANTDEAGMGRTLAVGMYPLGSPSQWEVMDLAGNVWEWCSNEYEAPARTLCEGDASRVLRGGAWCGDSQYCRAANRYGGARPNDRNVFIGFRVSRGAPIGQLNPAPPAAGSRRR